MDPEIGVGGLDGGLGATGICCAVTAPRAAGVAFRLAYTIAASGGMGIPAFAIINSGGGTNLSLMPGLGVLRHLGP